MKALFLPPPASAATIDLDEAAAVEAVCERLRSSSAGVWPLHIDCGQLRCQRTLGVSHIVSQLLRLRQAGASIRLQNVNAPLRHCLQLLQVSALFCLVEAD